MLALAVANQLNISPDLINDIYLAVIIPSLVLFIYFNNIKNNHIIIIIHILPVDVKFFMF